MSGRAALYHTLWQGGIRAGSAAMVPAYLAAGVINPLRHLGLNLVFYPTQKDLLFKEQLLIDTLEKREDVRVLVVLHPMGRIQAIERLLRTCRQRNVLLVEDCVQGLFTRSPLGEPIGSKGDVSLFSLPKFIGTVDGAAAFTRRRIAQVGPLEGSRPLTARMANGWHWAHQVTNLLLHHCSPKPLSNLLLGVGSFFYERYYALAGSDFRSLGPCPRTREILRKLDIRRIVDQRRRHVEYLCANLKSSALQLVYPTDWPGWIPLAVPAFVIGQPRAVIQHKARRAGILLATLCDRWDHLPSQDLSTFTPERYYLDHHVLIPINEHISDECMHEIVERLNQL